MATQHADHATEHDAPDGQHPSGGESTDAQASQSSQPQQSKQPKQSEQSSESGGTSGGKGTPAQAGQAPSHLTTSRERLLRALFGELIGTFILTFAAAGPDVMGVAAGSPLSQFSRLLPQGFIIAALIYTIGNVSGAHLNPAVTFAFALRRDFPWRIVPLYWLVQLLGATGCAIFLDVVFGDAYHLGADTPSKQLGELASVLTELVLTTILILVILATAHDHRLIGQNAALAVGLTLAALGLIASPVSGASMNPARSFGPALIGGTLQYMWIYVLGPMAGAILACALEWGLNGSPTAEAQKAAQGGHEG